MPHAGSFTLHRPRRECLRRLGAVGLGVALAPLLPRRAAAENQATYLTWPGYDILDLQTHYRSKYHAEPNLAVFNDPQNAFEILQSGSAADVIHPCAENIPTWKSAGLLQPIDVSRLKNWSDIHKALQELPAGVIDGQHFFVPWEWGVISISYRTDLVDIPDGESWGILWDERYKGKIALLDSALDSWWSAAIYAGIPSGSLDGPGLGKTGAALRDLLRNAGALVSDTKAVEEGLSSGRIVAAVTWPNVAHSLQSQGLPVKFAMPKEGTLKWVCGLVLHKGAPQLGAAYDLIDGMLAPDVGAYCIRHFGYGHSNLKSFAQASDGDLKRAHLPRDPSELLQRGRFKAALPASMTVELNRLWYGTGQGQDASQPCACAGPKALLDQRHARRWGEPPP